MDGKQFDRLTKRLGSGASRRRVLGGLGAVGAGLLTRRTEASKARPTSGCGHAGRACTPDGTTSANCCGNEKLTCAAPGGVSPRCDNTAGNYKCCAPVGTACHAHCECCSPGPNQIVTECRNGVCAECQRVDPATGACLAPR
jgi:hypothetical protein